MRLSRDHRGFTLIELLVVIAIIAILAAILFPVFAKARERGRTATCVSNMSQLAKAMQSYVTEWRDCFPTNRYGANLLYEVPLSGVDPATGKPLIYKYGVNWVEALYTYTEPVGATSAETTQWTCPSAYSAGLSATMQAGNTYAFNYCLLEEGLSNIKNGASMMLLREMDRRFGSVCRPTNLAINSSTRPRGTFLTNWDPQLGTSRPANFRLHGAGSNVCFVDGHVKGFPSGQMPTDDLLKWDGTTSQWWNSDIPNNKLIAINP